MLKHKFNKLKDKFSLILESEVLSGLSPTERTQLLNMCHQRHFNKDEVIFNQGDPGSGLYLIKSGLVELLVKSNGEENVKDLTQTLEPPTAFGMLSLVNEQRRFYTAIAREETVLYGFFQPDLKVLKERYPGIAVTFISQLATYSLHLLIKNTARLAESSSQQDAHSVFIESDSFQPSSFESQSH
jgi:CRP-like cAMP-binding protein